MNTKNNTSNSSNLNEIDENEEPNPNEDVMIKLIRVVANLAINEHAGGLLATKPELFDVLLKILGKLKLQYVKIINSIINLLT
jgi:hypothetical protein